MKRLGVVAVLATVTQQPLSRSIEVWSAHPVAVQIDWLKIDHDGLEKVIARQRRAIGPPVPLEFEHAPDRFVRFSYEGASPRTYSTSELLTARRLRLPDALPGGELFLFVPHSSVRPAELRVEGPRIQTFKLASGSHASLAGAPSGRYLITPIYEGGLQGATRASEVTDARTTLSFVAPEDVGAVHVIAPQEICGSATEMGINELVPAKEVAGTRLPASRSNVARSTDPRCEVTVAGLRPGQFEAYYRKGAQPVGTGRFSIAPQQLTAVNVVAGLVRVHGRVTMNGQPVTSGSVVFAPDSRSGVSGPGTRATLDDSGSYRGALQDPGRYSVAWQPPRGLSSRLHPVELVEGDNRYDLALTGGKLVIDITGAKRNDMVSYRIQGHREDGTTWMANGTFRFDDQPFVLEPLPFGRYRVTVNAGPPVPARGEMNMSSAKPVVLSASSPQAALTFSITRR
jgi:hypothetical protein